MMASFPRNRIELANSREDVSDCCAKYANLPGLEDPQKMFRACLNQLQVADCIKQFVHDRTLRASAVAAGFGLDEFGHDLAQGAFDKTHVGGGNIRSGDLQI